MPKTKITAIIFDFAGVVTTTGCFPALSEKLGREFSVEKQLIQERLYANESEYALGNESTRAFWEKTCADLSIGLEGFEKAFASWYEI